MPEKDKSLEMRVAEIEDKLAQLHITDDEMKAFNKVAAAMGLQGSAEAGSAAAASAAPGGAMGAPAIPRFINRGIGPCRIFRGFCICQCICPCINECTCGPCIAGGGGGGFGGGFGGFGS